MGQIFVCDWCKQACDRDTVSQISFKKPGEKRFGNKWDVCDDCTGHIQTRLVKATLSSSPRAPVSRERDALDSDGQVDQPLTLGDLDEGEWSDGVTAAENLRNTGNDEALARQIQRDHAHREPTTQHRSRAAELEIPQEASSGLPVRGEQGVDKESCMHANRDHRVVFKTDGDGRRHPYNKCRDCGTMILYINKAAKSNGLAMSAGDGVRFRDGGGATKETPRRKRR